MTCISLTDYLSSLGGPNVLYIPHRLPLKSLYPSQTNDLYIPHRLPLKPLYPSQTASQVSVDPTEALNKKFRELEEDYERKRAAVEEEMAKNDEQVC
eukprot:sb/3479073/